MNWWFSFLDKTDSTIRYAYSTDSKSLDGIILYDIKTEQVSIEKPSENDDGFSNGMRRAIRHFYKVISEGFPKERHVCCG